MKLLILDPGYAHAHSHHHVVNRLMTTAFRDLGWEVTIAASRAIDDETRSEFDSVDTVCPIFETPCYGLDENNLGATNYRHIKDKFCLEVTETISQHHPSAVLFHTGFGAHFSGLADAILRLNASLRCKFMVLGMFPPSGSSALENHYSRQKLRTRNALRLLYHAGRVRGMPVTFAVSCKLHRTLYRDLWPGYVLVHPAINYRPLETDEKTVPERDQVILYLGCPKKNKGFPEACRLAIVAAKKFPQVTFNLHFNQFFPESKLFVTDLAILERDGECLPNLEIIRGHLCDRRFDNLLLESKVICMLYDPHEYREKSSGILWEALRVPHLRWLVTESTWMQQELTELRIAHRAVPFGGLDASIRELGKLLRLSSPPPLRSLQLPLRYRRSLLSSFPDWLIKQL